MGNEVFNDSHPFQYGVFTTEKKPGETPILRRPDTLNALAKTNKINRNTQVDCVEYYKNLRPNSDFLGTRQYDSKNKTYLINKYFENNSNTMVLEEDNMGNQAGIDILGDRLRLELIPVIGMNEYFTQKKKIEEF